MHKFKAAPFHSARLEYKGLTANLDSETCQLLEEERSRSKVSDINDFWTVADLGLMKIIPISTR